MTAKYKKKRIKGIRITEKIEGKKERPMFPRPAVFKDKKTYDRQREKSKMRKELGEE